MPNATILAARRAIDATRLKAVASRSQHGGDWRVFNNPNVSVEYFIKQDDRTNIREEMRIAVTGLEHKAINLRLVNDAIETIRVGEVPLDEKSINRNTNHIRMALATIRAAYIRSKGLQPPG